MAQPTPSAKDQPDMLGRGHGSAFLRVLAGMLAAHSRLFPQPHVGLLVNERKRYGNIILAVSVAVLAGHRILGIGAS